MKKYLPIIISAILILALIGGRYWIYKKYKSGSNKSEENNLQSQTIPSGSQATNPQEQNSEFYNNLYKLLFIYPSDWKVIEIKGDTAVTAPFVREDIASLYKDSETKSRIITLKLLRFVIEPEVNINSEDDWYNYMKTKVEKYQTNKEITDSTGYQLKSLDKIESINGLYAVREKYTLKNEITGEDYYINNGRELYQFVFECKSEFFGSYSEIIKNIARSFKINK